MNMLSKQCNWYYVSHKDILSAFLKPWKPWPCVSGLIEFGNTDCEWDQEYPTSDELCTEYNR